MQVHPSHSPVNLETVHVKPRLISDSIREIGTRCQMLVDKHRALLDDRKRLEAEAWCRAHEEEAGLEGDRWLEKCWRTSFVRIPSYRFIQEVPCSGVQTAFMQPILSNCARGFQRRRLTGAFLDAEKCGEQRLRREVDDKKGRWCSTLFYLVSRSWGQCGWNRYY